MKLCVLVLHDSETGNVCAVPVDRKKNAEFLTVEAVRFMSWLGYSETILRCDQEPVMLKLQDLIQQSRLKANLKTIKENPPIRAPPSNRSVENVIQWIRGVSNTLLHYLRARTG